MFRIPDQGSRGSGIGAPVDARPMIPGAKALVCGPSNKSVSAWSLLAGHGGNECALRAPWRHHASRGLQRFRAWQLKIDRFFTDGLNEYGQEGSAIVFAIIRPARTLDMDVAVQGVETDSQFEILKGMRPDEMQRFLPASP